MNKSAFAKYLKEEDGCDTIETEYGFCSYNYYNETGEFFCAHIYVEPRFRKRGKGVDFGVELEKHARSLGAKSMTGNIWLNKFNRNRFTEKIKIFEAFGFVVDSVRTNVVTLVKFLED